MILVDGEGITSSGDPLSEQIMHTGHNPDAVSFEDMQALIRQRMSR